MPNYYAFYILLVLFRQQYQCTNNILISLASDYSPYRAYCERIDILIPFTVEAVPHVLNRLTPNTCIIGEKKYFGDQNSHKCSLIDISFERIAEEVGNRVYSNSVAVGVLSGLFKADRAIIADAMSERFTRKGKDVFDKKPFIIIEFFSNSTCTLGLKY